MKMKTKLVRAHLLNIKLGLFLQLGLILNNFLHLKTNEFESVITCFNLANLSSDY
jgi:hypothetical protein